VIVTGFDRPNIHLAVESFAEAERKREALEQLTKMQKESG